VDGVLTTSTEGRLWAMHSSRTAVEQYDTATNSWLGPVTSQAPLAGGHMHSLQFSQARVGAIAGGEWRWVGGLE